MAEWSQSSVGPARTRSGRRKHWKLPDMILGVRHRFRDKMRSKSPDYCLDDTASQTSMYKYNPENGGATLPRASSMLSTDYGFSQSEWGSAPADGQLTRATALQSNYRALYPASSHDVSSTTHTGIPSTPCLDTFRSRSGTSDFAQSSHNNTRPRLPMVSESRFQSSFDNGALSDCDFGSSSVYHQRSRVPPAPPRHAGVGRAASVSAVNQAGISHGITHGSSGSMQRGKSVRFGENRISVFLQDSTQALEECVRLALSYAEESKRGDYCSDSEAVTLSRSLTQSQDPEILSNDNKARSFWSDSEDRGTNKSEVRDHSHVNFSDGPPTPTNYKPRSFGQAVNSLDRVERLDKYQTERSRKKRSTQINEIFSFIDKVLSGCDNGCNDEGCPFAREAKSLHAKTHRGYYGKDWSTPQKNYQNNSHIPSEYQNKKSASFPRGSTVDSYAYKGKLATEGRLAEGGFSPHSSKKSTGRTSRSATPLAGAGYDSDSDCDTSGSTCSTMAGRGASCSTMAGRGGKRPPRSRLRTDRNLCLASKRTTEDVFAQIIICSESNKESLGMPKYGHIHQKISQTVCNAIFLCKVRFFWSIHNLWDQELDTLLMCWVCAKNLIYAFDQLREKISLFT